ncbi:uncharacterized protein LOC9324976 isoform X2 [Arabidopsis lyrata subsp. lyrata]|uniref:uncharacterized protein LOC9324976 isoform X2 n=1 Tax=Arabidopsis lyrata subsp. lyrata TaxID=81972 RepID=UPI000A29CACF|nr:uncharacterized protein LOC9324976 isoform X2 [Arabidopsis lyrata subsp. lyrata]|eukprot:XP_020865617.1 uncharacterized protein LOC9324976 isoform X2 [Arabidopsis lyrata subsp. lyrata]
MWWWSSSTKGRSNLERFLLGITPKPPSFSHPQGKEEIEYFRLGDLWDCYDEMSAYGFGTQVDLSNGETVMQYYVPYLSAIQIHTNKPALLSRNQNEVAESESSEGWSDSESEKLLSRSLSNDSSKTWDAVSEDSVFDPDGTPLLKERLGCLDFKYIERDPPHKRIPLTDKINVLVEKYPGLMTLRSVDMSPASWMAVAWYPIYQIPTCRNEKDLTTGFLTYHTLSSSFQDNVVEGDQSNNTGNEETEFCEESVINKRIPLPPFGVATYKMQGDLWGMTGFDQDRLVYLQSAADSWLKQLNVDHHDYNFFLNSSF